MYTEFLHKAARSTFRMAAALAAAGLSLSMATSALASAYPSKPIRFIAPAPPGSLSDSIARTLGQALSEELGQPVVVENKPGSEGMIAAMDVKKAAADGYTLLFATNSPMAAVPAMMKTPPYDAIKDFTPITTVGQFTFFLYVNSSVQAKTFQELVDHAKANPGKLTYGTANSTGTVGTAQILSQAGVDMLQVPYKGEPQAMLDLAGGRIDLMLATPTTGLGLVKDGKARALATSVTSRSPMLPDVPTIYEAGLPGFSIVSWGAVFGPANLPGEIVSRLNEALNKVMRDPGVVAAAEKQGVMLKPSSPEGLATYQRQQIEQWKETVKRAGIQTQ